ATSAIVDQCFVPGVFVDNGQPFEWVWRGAWQSPSFYRRRWFPTPWYRKNFRQIRFFGTGNVDFSLATDFANGEVLRKSNLFKSATSTWGGAGQFGANDGSVFGDYPTMGEARVFSLGTHRAVSVVFSSTSTTADAVNLYALMMTDRRDMVPA